MRWASWVESNLPDGHWEDSTNYVAPCAFHKDSNPSMAVEADKGVFVCRSCGARGRIERLAQQLQVPAVPMISHDMLMRKLSPQPLEDTQVELYREYPESWLDQFDQWHPYWESRFNPEVIKRFRLGYDSVRNCATIPVRNNQGRVVGVIRRRLDGRKPKYLEPKGLPKQEMLWGSWEAPDRPEQLVIVEGPADALACWEVGVPAVALCGSYMSTTQAKLVRRMCPQTVLIGMDNDAAGRGHPYHPVLKEPASGTWRVKELLQGLRETKVIVWSGKDPGEITTDVRLDDITWAVDWLEWKRTVGAQTRNR